MKYYIDITYHNNNWDSYLYDLIKFTPTHMELYSIKGIVFKKSILIHRVLLQNIKHYDTGLAKKGRL